MYIQWGCHKYVMSEEEPMGVVGGTDDGNGSRGYWKVGAL
jgi:hypothetical protein